MLAKYNGVLQYFTHQRYSRLPAEMKLWGVVANTVRVLTGNGTTEQIKVFNFDDGIQGIVLIHADVKKATIGIHGFDSDTVAAYFNNSMGDDGQVLSAIFDTPTINENNLLAIAGPFTGQEKTDVSAKVFAENKLPSEPTLARLATSGIVTDGEVNKAVIALEAKPVSEPTSIPADIDTKAIPADVIAADHPHSSNGIQADAALQADASATQVPATEC